jgi:hypothetical protein
LHSTYKRDLRFLQITYHWVDEGAIVAESAVGEVLALFGGVEEGAGLLVLAVREKPTFPLFLSFLIPALLLGIVVLEFAIFRPLPLLIGLLVATFGL